MVSEALAKRIDEEVHEAKKENRRLRDENDQLAEAKRVLAALDIDPRTLHGRRDIARAILGVEKRMMFEARRLSSATREFLGYINAERPDLDSSGAGEP